MNAGNGRARSRLNVEDLRPRYCVWELTLACNLRCGHCGSRAGQARPDELDTGECLKLVKDLAALGCEVITLSGGEPTLREDWPAIAAEIRRQGMIPNMVTNGVGMDAEKARLMKEAGLSNVAVSIDGPPDIHERIRGKGTYPGTGQAVRLLQEAGLPVTVMTTVNALNLSRLEEVHAACKSLGVSRWRLQLGKPMGNLDDHEDWVIRPRDLLYLLPRLHRLAIEDDLPVGIGDSIGFFGPYDEPLRATSWKGTPQRWAGCQAGLQAIGIEANGGVKGCLSLQAFAGEKDPFVEGNIRERSLKEIWRDPNLFAYNRRASVKELTGFCASCSKKNVCKGGAKCVASAVTGDVLEDPYCYHRVAELARRQPIARMRGAVAAAAAGASIGLVTLTACGPEYGVEAPDCAEVDCADPELDPYFYEYCCEAAYPEYGVSPDYGVEPDCSEVDCADPNSSPEEWDACCPSVDYGVEPVDCSEVDCADPDLSPEEQECCMAPEYGVEPVDCTQVDCADSSITEEERLACCASVDYGVEPVDCTQ
ncbi:MAG: radical SAM/SPASM domain-containing protein, partial [Myxococcota bacterium]